MQVRDPELAARLNVITQEVIGLAFKVSNTLGAGFLEKVYENALAHECRKAGLRVTQQQRILVVYDGVTVGDFNADMVIEDLILVELKAARAIDASHEAQCINYLAATGMHLCLLLNFAARVGVRRFLGKNAPPFPPGSEFWSHGPPAMTRAEEAELGPMP